MKSLRFAFSVLILVLSGTLYAQQTTTKIQVFWNANIIPMTEDNLVLNNMDLHVQGNKIVKIEASRSKRKYKKSKYEVRDYSGRFIMPGLCDSHAHLPGDHGQEFDMEEYLFLNLANGVTSIRCTRGEESQLTLKEEIESGKVLGPRLYISAPAIGRSSNLNPDDANEWMKEYKDKGYDFLKYLSGFDSIGYPKFMEVARNLGMKVAGHGPSGGLMQAIENNQHSIEHITPFLRLYRQDSAAFFQAIEEMKSKDMYNCPDVLWYITSSNLFSLDELNALDGLSYVPKKSKTTVARQIQ